jgi:hypothetical protein
MVIERLNSVLRRVSLVCLLLPGAVLGASRVHAQPRMALEYQMKAAFLYNFARFVEWPPDAFAPTSDSLIVGLIGEDPFGVVLDQTLGDKLLHDKKVVVRRFQRIESVVECHILFISASEEPRLGEIMKALNGASVLTVGDLDGFVERGGIIGFRKQDKKVRFEINADVAKRVGLKISSQLLKLAIRVIGARSSQADGDNALP